MLVSEITNIVLPVFGLIAVGYCVAWSGLLTRPAGEALADFVFVIAIPLLIFRTIATADFSGAEPWRIWLPYFAVLAVVWVIGDLVIRRGFGRDARAGLVGGVSGSYSNVALVGIPLVMAAYGHDGVVALALIIAVHMPVMMTASAMLIGRAERRDGAAEPHGGLASIARSVVRSLVTNPIIIGLFAGALWRLFGLPYAGVPTILVDRLADVAATLALFALGMSLRKYGIRRNIPAGIALSILKLVVMPGVVLLVTRHVVPMPPVWTKVAVIAAACPTGVNAYLIAARFRTGEALASNTILISTGFAVVTVTIWMSVLEWI
ncbi:MAG: AEC family transporter [Bauldia sp.]|uniref:AEC family transporter n=1 Tax=Bauldia sp. TaxID=2575872 RepID=UPI001DAF812F|nr:AEC family transporter [Bauldia sp.]MCB1489867.1 AEC family transporter [Bauldia sp.]MCB1498022.1 AEC family transporter [Bauldia sp.]